MAIEDFTERQIADSILTKINPKRKRKSGKHSKRYIYIGNTLVGKVKVPNKHDRIMKENKSQYIAQDLKLSDENFNDLINCPLTGPKYYELIENEL